MGLCGSLQCACALTVGDGLTLSGGGSAIDPWLVEIPATGAWTSWTPQVDQGASTNIAKTILYAEYVKFGLLTFCVFALTVTGAGTATNAVQISLPVTASNASGVTGPGAIYDASTVTRYAGFWEGVSTTRVAMMGDWAGGAQWGFTPNLALANGDIIKGSLLFEAAA